MATLATLPFTSVCKLGVFKYGIPRLIFNLVYAYLLQELNVTVSFIFCFVSFQGWLLPSLLFPAVSYRYKFLAARIMVSFERHYFNCIVLVYSSITFSSRI